MGDAQGPNSYQIIYRLNQPITIKKVSGNTEYRDEDIFTLIERVMNEGIKGAEELPFNFTGGLVGYLGYELKQLRFPDNNRHISSESDACLLFSDRFVAVNRETQSLYLVGLYKTSAAHTELSNWFASAKDKIAILANKECEKLTLVSASRKDTQPAEFNLEQGREEYIAAINTCQEHIRNGQSYEICLTNRLKTEVKAEP